MATKLVSHTSSSSLKDDNNNNGKKYLKETNNIVDFDKEKERNDDTGWDFGGTINTNTLHKNDKKSGQLIDEISDLRDVLRRSVIGPLSREMIETSEDFTHFTEEQEKLSKLSRHQQLQLQQQQQQQRQKMNSVHAGSSADIVDDAHGSSHYNNNNNNKDIVYDSLLEDLANNLAALDHHDHQSISSTSPASNAPIISTPTKPTPTTSASASSEATVTITKEKLINLMKEYKKTKDNLKDHSSHIQEMDNQLNEVKGDLELKKKKIQLLKGAGAGGGGASGGTGAPVDIDQYQQTFITTKPQQIQRTANTAATAAGQGQGLDKKISPVIGRMKSHSISTSTNNLHQPLQQQPSLSQSQQQSQPQPLKRDSQLNSSINNLLQTAQTGVITDDINTKIIEVLNTAKYRIERVQFKNRVLLTSSLHSLSTEIHSILERRVTKRQVNAELRQNAAIVADCDAIKTTVTNFMNELERQKQGVESQLEEAHKKKLSFKTKAEKSRRVMELDRQHRQIESAISFLKIEKRSVRELRDRFVSVCNDVTRLYEACNTIERDLSKWDIELERIYLKVKDGIFSDYFKLHPVFQSCSARIKDHAGVKQDLVRELARREASRIASEIYVSGISQILECGTDLITDERMVDVARVRGLEHQVHMLYHALHDQQTVKTFNSINNTSIQNLEQLQHQHQPTYSSSPQHSPPMLFNQLHATSEKKTNSIGSSSSSGSSHNLREQQQQQQVNNKPMSPVTQHHRASSPIPILANSTGGGDRASSPLQQSMHHQHQSSPNSFTSIAVNKPTNMNTNTPPLTGYKTGLVVLSGSGSIPKPLPNPHTNTNTQYQPSPPKDNYNNYNNNVIVKPEQASPLVKPVSIKPDSPSINNINSNSNNNKSSPVISKAPPTPIVISAIDQSPKQRSQLSNMNISSSSSSDNNSNTGQIQGSLVMETMIKKYDVLFPFGQRSSSSPILAKTATYLDALSELTAEGLIQSANIASGFEGKFYSDSLKVNGTAMKADQVDVYMTSELLKHFFRESNDPFITKQAYQEWLLAEKIEELDKRLNAIKLMIIKITDENRSILASLLKTLHNVVKSSNNNNNNSELVSAIARSYTCLILRSN